MPEHLKALVVVLGLATVVFAFAKAPACARACTEEDFRRRRNLWFGITLAAFLAHSFWIFLAVAAALLLLSLPGEPRRLGLFFLVLFAVPRFSAELGGFGVVKNLFEIDYVRLLVLTVLLPTFLSLRRQPGVEPFGRSTSDKLIAGYLVLIAALMLAYGGGLTNTLRKGVFYPFLDIFLPYYVASRALRDLQGFRDALMAFAVAALVMSATGAFEFVWRWLLYSSLDNVLGARFPYGEYLQRGDYLRAAATAGQAIPMGYVVAVAMGFYLYLRTMVPSRTLRGLGLMLLVAGLVAPLSRGPWVGAAAMYLVYVATGPHAMLRFATLGLVGALALPPILATPVGEMVVKYLPFVGTIDEANVAYRQMLLEISLEVFLLNPFFGSPDYIEADAMKDLVQGQGIVDLVNTYVGVGLSSGVVGLALFSGFFLSVALGIYRAMRGVRGKNDEQYLLGQALLATLLGVMVIIFTVSPITIVPVVYWSVAGVGAAYVRMLAPVKTPPTLRAPVTGRALPGAARAPRPAARGI
jgi:hypothetical protein